MSHGNANAARPVEAGKALLLKNRGKANEKWEIHKSLSSEPAVFMMLRCVPDFRS
jgi:hypothetical protein